jgi:hypothetical protein
LKRLLHVIVALFMFSALCALQAAIVGVNELENNCFIDGNVGWDFDDPVLFNAGGDLKFGRPHIAFDPDAPSGQLRQVVDDSLAVGWRPDWTGKHFELTADILTTGTGYLRFGVEWWNSTTMPKPSARTAGDGVIWSNFYTSTNDWTTVTWEQTLNLQPKWTKIIVEFYGCVGTGNEAAVDDMSFVAECVPEPSSIFGLGLAGVSLMGYTLRKRTCK